MPGIYPEEILYGQRCAKFEYLVWCTLHEQRNRIVAEVKKTKTLRVQAVHPP
jgi:hypothetical protein